MRHRSTHRPVGSGNPAAFHQSAGIRLAVAGGGTGGHLFPGIAIAQALVARRPGSRARFIGTDRPFEAEAVAAAGFDHRSIHAAGLKGRGLVAKTGALAVIPRGVFQAAGILRDFAPHLVLGMGGYSAGPVGLAAWLRGIPRALHEQNRLPGLTNRLLGRLADRVYISFEQSRSHFPPDRCRLTGNPVRRELLASDRDDAVPRRDTARPFTLLVFGGSQGAHRINTAMVGAAMRMANRREMEIIHQTGARDLDRVRAGYAEAGINARVAPFFREMGALYRRADLVICRAGATTVAELTAVGKAALFIPFPHAADDHQSANAQTLVEAGAGDMIAESELTEAWLAQRIEQYRREPETLARMARNARALGRPEAAEAVVDDILAFLSEKGRI